MKLDIIEPIKRLFYFQAEPKRYSPRKIFPGTHEIEIILRGKGVFWNNGKRYDVSAGDMVWYYPGEIIEADGDSSDPYYTCVIWFGVEKPPEQRPPFYSKWKSVADALDLCKHVQRLQSPGQAIPVETWEALWYRIYWESLQAEHTLQTEAANPAVRKALDYIGNKHAGDITVEDIACAAGVSAPHLHLLFRNATGMSPMRQVLKLRLESARNLLFVTQKSVKEISTACGFNDVNNFCVSFKKNYGIPPGQYRKQREASSA
jgi:AraC-like DNA-binding protein